MVERPTGPTDESGGNESPGPGPVRPRGATASGPPAPFLGRPRVGEAQPQRPADSTAAGGLRPADHGSAHGAAPHTPGARAHGQDHPRDAGHSLSSGHAPSGSGRARPTVSPEVRSQWGQAPRGAEARHDVGALPPDAAPAGGHADRPRAGAALRHPRCTGSRGPGGDACPARTALCTDLAGPRSWLSEASQGPHGHGATRRGASARRSCGRGG